jgi:hypothetical protein
MWQRKSNDKPAFKEYPTEDLFLCPLCNEWAKWFLYCKGKCLIFGYDANTYEYMNDPKTRPWGCDACVDKLVTEKLYAV